MILIASVMATVAMSQTMTPQQERDFYKKAYDLINMYAQSATISDDRDATQFQNLFESDDIQICNDLMSLSYEPTLSVTEYIRLLREADMVTVHVKNMQKLGSAREDNGVWLMTMAFDKSISFVSPCNSFFDSYDFFGRDYKLLMTLIMDGEDGECRIRELHADEDMPEFPKDYRVLQKVDEHDQNLVLNGNYVKFVMDQKILRPGDKLTYRGGKVFERDMEGECDHKVWADYREKTWRIRLGGSFALTGFNKMGGSSGISTSKDGETAFGLDFGYVIPTTKRLHYGVFAGIGFSINNLTMELMPNSNDLRCDNPPADEDGDQYVRMYEMVDGKGIVQKLKATDIVFPVYVDIEYELNSKYSIYADLGLKLQTSTGKMTTQGTCKTWGLYTKSEYGEPLEIGKDGDVDFNSFGTHNIGLDEAVASKSMSFDGLVGLGVRCNFSKSFAVDAGLQYQVGSKSWKADKGNLFSYTNEGGDKVNLLRKSGGIHHNSLKLAASLIYKF